MPKCCLVLAKTSLGMDGTRTPSFVFATAKSEELKQPPDLDCLLSLNEVPMFWIDMTTHSLLLLLLLLLLMLLWDESELGVLTLISGRRAPVERDRTREETKYFNESHFKKHWFTLTYRDSLVDSIRMAWTCASEEIDPLLKQLHRYSCRRHHQLLL